MFSTLFMIFNTVLCDCSHCYYLWHIFNLWISFLVEVTYYEYSNHWFWIVISILEETIYVLDSFPSESRLQLIVEIYLRLKQYFLDSNSELDMSDYDWQILPVDQKAIS